MRKQKAESRKQKPIQCNAHADGEPLLCRLPVNFDFPEPPKEFMVVPGGVHTITPSRGGKTVQVTVGVDRAAAGMLDAALQAHRHQSAQRPYFDFDHDEKKASAWPEKFIWKEAPAPGVYACAEWTKEGADAVTGKVYRGFSGAFFLDRYAGTSPEQPARITGAPFVMGGLTNRPAFKEILPLWAKDAGAPPAIKPTKIESNKTSMTPEEIAALQAKLQQAEQDNAALKAKLASADTDEAIKAKDAVIVEMKTKLTKAEEAIQAQRTRDAQQAVQAAVARGVIPAKDEALKARWEKRLVTEPEDLVLLASMAGNPAVQAGRMTGGPVILSEDPRNAIKAYEAEQDPHKRGAIYKREFSPILCKGGDLPIHAANSVGTLVGNVISQRVLELLKFQFPILSRIVTDMSAEQVNYSQSVYTRYMTVPTPGTYSTSVGYAATTVPPVDQAATDAYVTINAHKFVQAQFTANDLSGTARRLFDEFAPASAYALAKDLVDALYALILIGTYTSTAVKSDLADFGRSVVIDAGTALQLNGVPMGAQNRTLLLYSTYFGQLAKDNAIVTLAAFQDRNIIEAGVLPNVHGFFVIDAPNLPTTANLCGFAFSKSALLLATRLPNDYATILPGASFGSVQTVINPDTGAACVQTTYVDHNYGFANFRLAWMYGVRAGQPKAGQLLTSA